MTRQTPRGFFALGCLLIATTVLKADKKRQARRDFSFTYAVRVKDLPPNKTARIWIPMPSSSVDQQVKLVERDAPKSARITRDATFGNRALFVEAKPADGVITLSMTYHVTRLASRPILKTQDKIDRLREPFLKRSELVPIDGKPLGLLKSTRLPGDPMKKARALYDVVLSHVDYDKTVEGWGRGDVLWVCDSGKGNCSDFHSLFIALARSQKIPARFEIGFPLPEKRGGGKITGYHCWAKFYVEGKGWIPIDASEADKSPKRRDFYFGNLDENRIAFSVGRDLQLSPMQKGKPINFFIYPHVEVGGAPHPLEKIEKTFAFRDLKNG